VKSVYQTYIFLTSVGRLTSNHDQNVYRPHSTLQLDWHFNFVAKDHVSDALAILHWLRLPQRVNFKLALMAYRELNGMAPPYLNQLVPVSSLPGRRRLRSSFTLQLHVPQTVCQQPAVARFLSQPPFSGTLCQTTCSLHRLPLHSDNS